MHSVSIDGARERRIRISLTTPTRPALVTAASRRVPGEPVPGERLQVDAPAGAAAKAADARREDGCARITGLSATLAATRAPARVT